MKSKSLFCSAEPRALGPVRTDGPLRLLQGALVHDVPEHGQEEGDGFAAAGFGDSDEVAARHYGRDGLGLDGSGLLVTVP